MLLVVLAGVARSPCIFPAPLRADARICGQLKATANECVE